MDEIVKALEEISKGGFERDEMVLDLVNRVITEVKKISEILELHGKEMRAQATDIAVLREEVDSLKLLKKDIH